MGGLIPPILKTLKEVNMSIFKWFSKEKIVDDDKNEISEYKTNQDIVSEIKDAIMG